MIGIFDSGVGGLTVAKEIMKELPGYDLVYFGDTARAPYGNKSKETIIKYALEDADFLIKKGAKILVIACNTASAYAYGVLKEKYPEIPVFEVITPAAEAAASAAKSGRIGVIGTRATVKSGIYEEKLKALGDYEITAAACPLFVPFIEEGWTDKSELKMIARRYLAGFKNIDTLILGCTHYPIIKSIIRHRAGRRVKLVDSAEAVTKKIKNFLTDNPAIDTGLAKNGKTEFFMSDVTEQNKKVADKILNTNIKIYESGDIE
jgi:glutamate racemase